MWYFKSEKNNIQVGFTVWYTNDCFEHISIWCMPLGFRIVWYFSRFSYKGSQVFLVGSMSPYFKYMPASYKPVVQSWVFSSVCHLGAWTVSCVQHIILQLTNLCEVIYCGVVVGINCQKILHSVLHLVLMWVKNLD